MTPLVLLVPCPLLLVLLALVAPRLQMVMRLGALLLWVQMGLAVYGWGPLLQSTVPGVALASGFRLDATAALFIILTTLVAATALTHAIGFFTRELAAAHPPSGRNLRGFYALSALFLLSMYAVCTADNLGVLWIAVEATTLLSAPLVYYHRSRTALEATWKYLIICSVGIAFAFFGTALVFAASQQVAALDSGSLALSTLMAHATQLPAGLLRLGFVFLLLGYGTKAGLFPLHAWLPDAHSEAPAPASALLSGALLNCALVALWRVSGLMAAAGAGDFVRATLLPMGVGTVLAASLFLLKQRDLKRLLAYSSMENVGLMATAVALDMGSGFALQAVNHSLVKVALFLLAGNFLQHYGTQAMRDIRGALISQPAQAVWLCLGAIAIAGTPPFGSFLAEWHILATAATMHQSATVIVICAALVIAFMALSTQTAAMVFGQMPHPASHGPRLTSPGRALVVLPALLVTASLLLGVLMPPGVVALLEGVAR